MSGFLIEILQVCYLASQAKKKTRASCRHGRGWWRRAEQRIIIWRA